MRLFSFFVVTLLSLHFFTLAQEGYLIICPKEFIPAIEPLSKLRQKEGYQVQVASTEKIYETQDKELEKKDPFGMTW